MSEKQFVMVRIQKSNSSRAHLIDRQKLHEVPAGNHTKFVPKVQTNPVDASGQLIVKPAPCLTLCEQDAVPVELAPLEATLCQTCHVKAGSGRIVAASGFRS